MAHTASHSRLIPGIRVRHSIDNRSAVILDRPDSAGRHIALIPVHLEGSTRRELWPVNLVRVRRAREQHVVHGGEYNPPVGYPLRIRNHAPARTAHR